ncbi:MAG: putative porin [Alistipes sp.]|nr:putative porin [Alistipes sp.]
MKIGLRILTLLAVAFLAALPTDAFAQLDARDIARSQRAGQGNALGGSNPFDTREQGEEGEEQRDTTRVKRDRKPLESYYLNDSIRALPNFMWTVDRDMNDVEIMPLDTTLSNWRIDHPYQLKGVGDMTLGGLGQSTLPFNYFDRPASSDFTFAQSYDSYTYRMDNVPFYNSKTPYLNFTYLESGQKRYREEHFEVTTAHNISPSTGFNVSYKARGTQGLYDWQRTSNHNLSVAFSHTGKRYSVHAAYVNNRIKQRENGGAVGIWAVADTTYEHPSGVPMKLAEAEAHNSYRNNSFFIKQAIAIPLQPVTDYDFSLADLTAVYFGHIFEYNEWNKLYTDKYAEFTNDRGSMDENGEFIPTTDVYYKNWYISPDESRDSIRERVISNRFFVEAQPWDRDGAVGRLGGGVGIDMYAYSQFAFDDYVGGHQGKVKKTAWYAYGAVSGKVKKVADWGANVKYYPSGYRSGDFDLNAHIALTARLRGRPVTLSGRFSQTRRSPSYWEENLFSNHYVWFNSFKQEDETRFELSLDIPDLAFEVGFWQGLVDNKIYYDAQSQVRQSGDAISLTSLYARKDFRLGGFHFDHRVLLQWSTNQEVIPVPLGSAYLSYYYEFWVEKKKVLRMQIGVDGRFNTKYYAPSYNPALGTFYNQRDYELGEYPYLDVFVTAKWKRMRIFLKYQHANYDLFGNGQYFTVAGYPQNPAMFKFGISWGFYD